MPKGLGIPLGPGRPFFPLQQNIGRKIRFAGQKKFLGRDYPRLKDTGRAIQSPILIRSMIHTQRYRNETYKQQGAKTDNNILLLFRG
jgi:hypothetical protein